MKKLLLSFAVTCAAFTAIAGAAQADNNPNTVNSKYCRDMIADPICMGPEMLAMRAQIMAMTKEKALEARSHYCRDIAVGTDPICDPKMMTDLTGF